MSKSNIVFNLGLSDLNLIGKLVPKNKSYLLATLVSLGVISFIVFFSKKECRKNENKRMIKQMCFILTKYFFSKFPSALVVLLMLAKMCWTQAMCATFGMHSRTALSTQAFVYARCAPNRHAQRDPPG